MGSAVASILIYALIAVFVFRRIRKLKGRSLPNHPRGVPADTGMSPAPQTVRQTVVSGQASYPARKKNSGVNVHMTREKIDLRSWEDRKNDWMARQMAEERVAKRRMSEMFQMKMEHRYNCEAEMLKQFHEARCNAGEVDDGENR